ncbi:VPA1267 family protein [Massilia aurea]|uniref:VPA1267 family protein n=1 Tax=Massilia aurea TaxID=373040 RepID=UPI00216338C5|nr:VPA1267 family protein [Massilia aurea]MCS0708444.1 VPA1267 family protein [Massilia aurea]
MANGQQLAEQNFQTFCSWVESKTSDDFRQMVVRGGLSRREIAAQCGFSTSALNQNPRIKTALFAKEESLREVGILPSKVSKVDDGLALQLLPASGTVSRSVDAERLKRLEQENASLKAENQELKRQLEKFVVLREVLSTTGRLPR